MRREAAEEFVMTTKPEFAEGGYVDVPGHSLTVSPAGHDAEGRALVSINGGPPEYLITYAEARAAGLAFLQRMKDAPSNA